MTGVLFGSATPGIPNPPPSVDGITFSPSSPTVADNATVGTFVTLATPHMTDGSTFPASGSFFLIVDDGGKFAITSNGDGTANVTVAASLAGDGGTSPSITVEADPNNTTTPFDQPETINIATSGGEVLLATITRRNPTGSTIAANTQQFYGFEPGFADGVLDSSHKIEFRRTIADGGAVQVTRQCMEASVDSSVRYARVVVKWADALPAGATIQYDAWKVAGAPDRTFTLDPATGATVVDYTVEAVFTNSDANNGTWKASLLDFLTAGTQYSAVTGFGTNSRAGWVIEAQNDQFTQVLARGFFRQGTTTHSFLMADIRLRMYASGEYEAAASIYQAALQAGFSGGGGVTTAARLSYVGNIKNGATLLRTRPMNGSVVLPGTTLSARTVSRNAATGAFAIVPSSFTSLLAGQNFLVAGDATVYTIPQQSSSLTAKSLSSNSSTLSAGIDASQTSIAIVATSFPTASLPFYIRIDAEDLKVTAISGGTLTVVRGQNGTTGASHLAAAAVAIMLTVCQAADNSLGLAAPITSGAALTVYTGATHNFTTTWFTGGGNDTGADGILNDCEWDRFDSLGNHIVQPGDWLEYPVAYLQSTKIFPPWDTTLAVPAAPASANYIPLSYSNVGDYFTYTPEGRLISGWGGTHLLSQSDSNARRQVKVTGYVQMGWPMNDMGEATLLPPRVHPSASAVLGADLHNYTRASSRTIPLLVADQFTGPWLGMNGSFQDMAEVDTSHMPEYTYVASAMTGDSFLADLASAVALRFVLNANPAYRNKDASDGPDQGPGTTYFGVYDSPQTRGVAWSVRCAADAVFMQPDFYGDGTTPNLVKQQLQIILEDCFAYYNAHIPFQPAGVTACGVVPTEDSNNTRTGPNIGITGISNANPGVVTANMPASPYNLDEFWTARFFGIKGMSIASGASYAIGAPTGTGFNLLNAGSHANIDTTGLGTYTSVSGANAVVTGTTIDLSADAPDLSGIVNNSDRICIPAATNWATSTFLIKTHDNTAKTLTVDIAPTGLTGATPWSVGGYMLMQNTGQMTSFQHVYQAQVYLREIYRGGVCASGATDLINNVIYQFLLGLWFAVDGGGFTADQKQFLLGSYLLPLYVPGTGSTPVADRNAQLTLGLRITDTGDSVYGALTPPQPPPIPGIMTQVQTAISYGIGFNAALAIGKSCSGLGPYTTPAGTKSFADTYAAFNARVLATPGNTYTAGTIGGGTGYAFAPYP